MQIDFLLQSLTKSDLEAIASDHIGKFEEHIASQIYDKIYKTDGSQGARTEVIGIIILLLQRVVIPKANEAIINRISLTYPVEASTEEFSLQIEKDPLPGEKQ